MSNKQELNFLLVKNAIFAGYLACLSYGLFFADSFGRADRDTASYNLVPFTEIRRYMSRVDVIGSARVLINLAGNIVVFIPFGFLLPAMWPKGEKHHPIAAVLVTITFSTVVELLQYLTRSGIADVDDVILNSIGGFVGYLLYRAVEAMHRKKKG